MSDVASRATGPRFASLSLIASRALVDAGFGQAGGPSRVYALPHDAGGVARADAVTRNVARHDVAHRDDMVGKGHCFGRVKLRAGGFDLAPRLG